jgi:hypothetical protein
MAGVVAGVGVGFHWMSLKIKRIVRNKKKSGESCKRS